MKDDRRTRANAAFATALHHPDGLPLPRRRWAALAIWLSMSLTVVDGAIANLALPSIARSVGAEAADAIWVVNGYQIVIAMLLLPLAAVGERIGHRRLYTAGQLLFILGALVSAAAGTLEALVIGRVIQGVGAAGVMSMNAALVRATYPQAELGRGIGRNAMVIGLAAAAGPMIGSAILSVAPWPWLFLTSLPLGVLAIALGRLGLPNSGGKGPPLDRVSALLNALAIGGLILGTERLGARLDASGMVILAAGGAAAVALVRRERNRPAPLVPIDLLRSPVIAYAAATSIITFAAQTMALVSLPFHLQDTLGRSIAEAGILLSMWPLAVAATALVAGSLADRYEPALLCCIGLTALAAGAFGLAQLSPQAGYMQIAACMAVCGAGYGLFQSPNNRSLIGSTPKGRSAAAGGLLASARLGGQTIGATIVAISFRRVGVHDTSVVLAIASAAAGIAAALNLMRLRSEASCKI